MALLFRWNVNVVASGETSQLSARLGMIFSVSSRFTSCVWSSWKTMNWSPVWKQIGWKHVGKSLLISEKVSWPPAPALGAVVPAALAGAAVAAALAAAEGAVEAPGVE